MVGCKWQFVLFLLPLLASLEFKGRLAFIPCVGSEEKEVRYGYLTIWDL